MSMPLLVFSSREEESYLDGRHLDEPAVDAFVESTFPASRHDVRGLFLLAETMSRSVWTDVHHVPVTIQAQLFLLLPVIMVWSYELSFGSKCFFLSTHLSVCLSVPSGRCGGFAAENPAGRTHR